MYSASNLAGNERLPGNEPLRLSSPRTRDGFVSIDVAEVDGEQATLRSQADGGVIAQLRLDHDDLVMRPTLDSVPDVTVEPEYWTTLETGRRLLFVAVVGDSFETFEGALERDPTVIEPVLVDRYPDRRIYRIALAEGTMEFTAGTAEAGGRLLEVTSSRDGWLIQLRFPTRQALVAFNDYCRDREVSVSVEHLRVSDDGDDGVVALTEKQQELLAVAHAEGYFDVPRGISQDELANRLGVSKSAVSQRLRRAIGELCNSTLTT